MKKKVNLITCKELILVTKGNEIGCSKFYDLRPKWCLPVGLSITMCVCREYKKCNKLMASASYIVNNY